MLPQPQQQTSSYEPSDLMGILNMLTQATQGVQSQPQPQQNIEPPNYAQYPVQQAQPQYHQVNLGSTINTPFNNYVIANMSKFYTSFQGSLKIPKNATSTVYVEGIPPDSTEREVARKFCDLYLYIVV